MELQKKGITCIPCPFLAKSKSVSAAADKSDTPSPAYNNVGGDVGDPRGRIDIGLFHPLFDLEAQIGAYFDWGAAWRGGA